MDDCIDLRETIDHVLLPVPTALYAQLRCIRFAVGECGKRETACRA